MKKIVNLFSLSLLVLLIASCDPNAGKVESAKISNNQDSLSYSLGVNIGNDMKTQGIEINTDVLAKGVKDGYGGDYDFSDTVIGTILESFQSEMNTKFEQEKTVMLQQNKEDGAKFLAENRSQEGILTLPGGLQYKIIKDGPGVSPSVNDSVMIHYRASFIDGTMFDQSYDRGLQGIRLSNVIQGLSEGIQLMNEGSVYELYISSEIGYGDEDFANIIPGGSTLIYRIELVDVVQ
jgi:FKBP-type peptidyl-prolyl cis-trans isomerase FklB